MVEIASWYHPVWSRIGWLVGWAVDHTMWSPVLVLAVWLGSSVVCSFCIKVCCWCPEQQSWPLTLHIRCSWSSSSSSPEPSSTSSRQTHTSIPESPVTCRRRVMSSSSSSSSSSAISGICTFSPAWHCAWAGIDTVSWSGGEPWTWMSNLESVSSGSSGVVGLLIWLTCGRSTGVVSVGFSE